jgi:ABC-type glycerol-3-phosphate transport system substrate-binding protein
MLTDDAKRLFLGSMSVVILMFYVSASHADGNYKPGTTNINLAVASNFYGVPPNSAITDIINEFEADNPNYTVTVVDNGATSDLEDRIINGNQLKVDLFLAADTGTPQDLLVNHFNLVAPYNASFYPPLYTFNTPRGFLRSWAMVSMSPARPAAAATIRTSIKRWRSPIQAWRLMELQLSRY